MNSSHRSARRLTAACCALLVAASATAQVVINVAFHNGYADTTPFAGSSSSDTWNRLWDDSSGLFPMASALTSANGQSTAIGFVQGGADYYGGGTPGAPNGIGLFDGYAHSNGVGEMVFTLSGLDEDASYDLYIYAGQNTAFFDPVTPPIGETTVFVGGQSVDLSFSGPQDAFILGANYAYFADITPAKFGEIEFGVLGVINGFTLVQNVSAIPEPSTYAVFAGIAALGLVLWRRRAA